jgi:hypothetical protein
VSLARTSSNVNALSHLATFPLTCLVKQDTAKSVRAFAAELAIYAVLVTGYFFLVLHVLGNWLYRLETQHRVLYALVAILLIAGQAVVLDAVTTVLFRLVRGRWR